MQQETWVGVGGYPFYEVSSLGRLRSLTRTVNRSDGLVALWRGRSVHGWIQRTHDERPRRVLVTLAREGGKAILSLHRLVLEAFVGPCPAGMQGCHNDGNPLNNAVDNLRWDTAKANTADCIAHGTKPVMPLHRGETHHCATLSDADVAIIRATPVVYGGQAALARQYGVSANTINGIVRGRTRVQTN